MKSILSSSLEFSEDQLRHSSLPFLSWGYFSAENAESRSQWTGLFEKDRIRLRAVVGNDIFRNEQADCFSDKKYLYDEALGIIQSCWPEYASMLTLIHPRLSMTTQDDPFESASDPKTFGQILYRMDSACPVKWAEILVHELGHHYLNIVLTTHHDQDVFNQPWDHLEHSAIRNTDRPLIGIYHGTFAQACMVELALRILKTASLEKYFPGAHRILETFENKFLTDYQTILSAGVLDFDESVKNFMKSIRVSLDRRAV